MHKMMMSLHFCQKISTNFLGKVGKQFKSAPKTSKNIKGKASSIPKTFFNRNRDVQCRTCKGYGHIQFV